MKDLSVSRADLHKMLLVATCVASCMVVSARSHAQTPKLESSYNTKTEQDTWPHADEIISDAEARTKTLAEAGYVWSDGRDTYRINVGGNIAYITADTYTPATQASLDATTETSKKAYPGYCIFYIYGKDLKFESSYQVRVGDGHASTNCNGIDGVSGVAFHGQPALLAIVSYFYTDTPAASSASEIRNDWFTTTVLLPLEEQPDGKWVFTQDTTCFAPTNQIKTLAQAKRYLATNCR